MTLKRFWKSHFQLSCIKLLQKKTLREKIKSSLFFFGRFCFYLLNILFFLWRKVNPLNILGIYTCIPNLLLFGNFYSKNLFFLDFHNLKIVIYSWKKIKKKYELSLLIWLFLLFLLVSSFLELGYYWDCLLIRSHLRKWFQLLDSFSFLNN